jgi:large subunit ribosomal protein L13
MKTISVRPQDAHHDWYVIDATDQILGRLATQVAHRLRGKHKPEYTPHVDTGDYIVVINADQVRVTGNKRAQKVRYRHSGYPGGIKAVTLEDELRQHPTRAIENAVKGMVPRNRLGRAILTKLRVYAGKEHPHEAQNPKAIVL